MEKQREKVNGEIMRHSFVIHYIQQLGLIIEISTVISISNYSTLHTINIRLCSSVNCYLIIIIIRTDIDCHIIFEIDNLIVDLRRSDRVFVIKVNRGFIINRCCDHRITFHLY